MADGSLRIKQGLKILIQGVALADQQKERRLVCKAKSAFPVPKILVKTAAEGGFFSKMDKMPRKQGCL